MLPGVCCKRYLQKIHKSQRTRKEICAPELYIAIVFVIIGFVFGFIVDSVNQVTLWITNGLFGGYTAANVLKWYWWRLNGYGYFWGMVIGIGSAICCADIIPGITCS